MKSTYVLMRTLVVKDQSALRYPVGVYSDKDDALKEGDRIGRLLSGAHPAVQEALGFIGIHSLTHVVVEVPYVAGAGLELPARGLIVPG